MNNTKYENLVPLMNCTVAQKPLHAAAPPVIYT